jgi:hypothetical protein
MAWRMVMRRCPMRSMTLVGDLAQTSDPAGASSWARVLRPYARQGFRVEELTVNYRTPAEIMTVAEPVLAAIDPALTAPTSVRDAGFAPSHRRVRPADLPAEVVRTVIDDELLDSSGTLAVIVGFAEINGRLGNLVNDRPDSLIPLLVLAIGVVVVAVATRRSLQDVDSASDNQHDSAE